jgi:tetratricopeptide (TPR) repeat protein
MGRDQEAILYLKKEQAVYPQELWGHLFLVVAYEELDRHQEARAEAAEATHISPQFAVVPPEAGLSKDVAINRRYHDAWLKAGIK